jgi:hypothetical protein
MQGNCHANQHQKNQKALRKTKPSKNVQKVRRTHPLHAVPLGTIAAA